MKYGGLRRCSEYTAVVHTVSGCNCSRCRHFVKIYTLKVYGFMKINLEKNVTILCAVVSCKSQLWQYCFSPRINSWFLEIHRVRPALDSVVFCFFNETFNKTKAQLHTTVQDLEVFTVIQASLLQPVRWG